MGCFEDFDPFNCNYNCFEDPINEPHVHVQNNVGVKKQNNLFIYFVNLLF